MPPTCGIKALAEDLLVSGTAPVATVPKACVGIEVEPVNPNAVEEGGIIACDVDGAAAEVEEGTPKAVEPPVPLAVLLAPKTKG